MSTDAYRALLDRLQPLQPRGGWSSVYDIPDLSDADLAAVAEEAGSIVLDAADSIGFVGEVIAQLRCRAPAIPRYAAIGADFVGGLRSLAKTYLLRDLRAEADRRWGERADEGYQSSKDRMAQDAGIPKVGEI